MSDYNRTTRECTVSQLQPDLRQAIQNYFREQNLGNPETETLMCCETVSTRKSSGWLGTLLNGGEDTIHTGMLLTSEWLVWVRKGDRSSTVLNAASLKEIQVKTYLSLLNRDNGLEISGYTRDSQGRARGYVGMGPELAAQRFCEEVEKAVAKVKPPAAKPFSRWFGG